jgi:hypothetical protein
VAFLFLRRPDARTAEETSYLAALREQDTDLAQADTLTQAFLTLVRQRQGARLDPAARRSHTEWHLCVAPLRSRRAGRS